MCLDLPIAMTLCKLLAAAVYEDIIPGSILSLNGLLGAGKTTFIQKLCQTYGVRVPVVSPTYSYVSTYEVAGLTIYHFDLYRISGIEEFEALGFYEYLNDSEEHLIEQMIYGIDCMRMAVLLYVFFYGLLNDVIVRNSYYNSHNYKVFLQYEAFYDLSNYLNTRIS